MHELAVCGAIADIVRRRAGYRRVGAVQVRVGQLRQIVPDTLSFCWDLVIDDTSLAGATLTIETIAAVVACRDCNHTTEIGDLPVFACRGCNSYNVAVVAGEELEVVSLDVVEV